MNISDKLKSGIRNCALPLSMGTGILLYLVYHWTPSIHIIGPPIHKTATMLQPVLIFLMLFLQFNKISPHDLKIKWWHAALLLIQGSLFIIGVAIAKAMPDGGGRILVESAMLCFITPTATAAGVITEKLGGNLSQTMTYIVLANCLAAILIPATMPLLNPVEGQTFIGCMIRIIGKVFPMLILPCIAAWIIRYTMRKVQIFLMRYAGMAFYIWSFSLTISLALTTRTLILSHMHISFALVIGAVSLVCCIFQFYSGHQIGKISGKESSVTAGQCLGQKNTIFQIWLGYSFLTPETSICGGFYSIWHNLVNSWELYKAGKKRN